MSDAPRVSAIIPVRNGERFLAEAIESVLNQSYRPLELLVIDGASTDRSVEIARSYEDVTVVAQDGIGLAGAWNQGVAASSGELIAFLDSDDYWLPGKIEAQVELLRQRPELAGVTGHVRFVIPEGEEAPPGMRPEVIGQDNPAPMPGTLLVRREVFDRIGDFDTAYEVAMDVDWFVRMEDAGCRLETLDSLVLVKRHHDSNLSHLHPAKYRKEMVMAFRDSIARKKAKEVTE